HANGRPAVLPGLRDQEHRGYDDARPRLLHDEAVVRGEGRVPALEQVTGPHAQRDEGCGRVLEPDLIRVEGGERLRVGPGGASQDQAAAEIAEHDLSSWAG